jgi:hypothetical protein
VKHLPADRRRQAQGGDKPTRTCAPARPGPVFLVRVRPPAPEVAKAALRRLGRRLAEVGR